MAIRPQVEIDRISKVMLRTLREFSRTGTLKATKATLDALVAMRYLKSTLQEEGEGFDYTLTLRGTELLASIPEELQEETTRVNLPIINCVPGCGDCCGPVPITEKERDRIQKYLGERGITPQYTGYLTCPFFQNGACSIYEVRPLVCHLFGHSRKLSCPRGKDKLMPTKILNQMVRENGFTIGLISDLFPIHS